MAKTSEYYKKNPKARKKRLTQQKKYNKTPSTEKNPNEYISIIDDLNIFNRDKTSKKDYF